MRGKLIKMLSACKKNTRSRESDKNSIYSVVGMKVSLQACVSYCALTLTIALQRLLFRLLWTVSKRVASLLEALEAHGNAISDAEPYLTFLIVSFNDSSLCLGFSCS